MYMFLLNQLIAFFFHHLNLRWPLGLKLIQWEQKNPATSSHYFSKRIKTTTLQGHKRCMKIFELEINNLGIEILAEKMM